MKRSVPCMVAGLALALSFSCVPHFGVSVVQAENLAGQKGKVRRRLPRRGNTNCAKNVDKYIAAEGHSAFATTDQYSNKGFICAYSLNRKSVEDAEKEALASCERGTQRWNRGFNGKCEIIASK